MNILKMGRYTFVLFSVFLLEIITVVTNNTSFVYFAPSPSMITFCSIVVQYFTTRTWMLYDLLLLIQIFPVLLELICACI